MVSPPGQPDSEKLPTVLLEFATEPPLNHWPETFREKPFGQKDNWTTEVKFDCLVVAITGKFHISYCTEAERLKLERGQNSARTLASANVPPLGINS